MNNISSTIAITKIETLEWLNNQPEPKVKIVNRALEEYRQRHHKGVYFTKREIVKDIEKHEEQLKEAKEKLPKLRKLLKEIEAKEKPDEEKD